ncbi:membrane protein [Scopulibacillus darangshiensis]|uniref:Membrane protein n=1 Tax=Scopulibacillus darangshiensis TaxID=442528 RepID=A0A4R2NWY0_9BACL|nr:YihY/virulence factor BrkB family protein [Scopulibacillus darangshiensis]TCP26610.1 membrane protein [Scopulibacillus darangshiensis]
MRKKKVFNQVLKDVQEDGVCDMAAALAYYFLLSLFPMLLFIISLIPFLSLPQDMIVQMIDSYAPGDTSQLIEGNVTAYLDHPNGGILSFGIIAALWSASSGTNALIRALNRTYGVDETRSFIRVKLMALGLTLALIFIIVITLALPIFGHYILEFIQHFIYIPDSVVSLINVLRWVAAIIIMVLTLMVLYHFAPNQTFNFREGLTGAVAATIGWQAISLGFAFYVSHFSHYSATYGSLGTVIVLMIWLFLTGIMLIIGGEVNAAFYRTRKNNRK